jgi:hypothetical protein
MPPAVQAESLRDMPIAFYSRHFLCRGIIPIRRSQIEELAKSVVGEGFDCPHDEFLIYAALTFTNPVYLAYRYSHSTGQLRQVLVVTATKLKDPRPDYHNYYPVTYDAILVFYLPNVKTLGRIVASSRAYTNPEPCLLRRLAESEPVLPSGLLAKDAACVV